MSRNTKNVLKFAATAAATFGALYCVAQTPMKVGHWIGAIGGIITFGWYTWHVYDDK